MKKPVHRRAYDCIRNGKRIHVKECTYYVDAKPKQSEGAGSEYENTVFDRGAWDKNKTSRQGTIPGTVNAQARRDRVVKYFNTEKVTPTGVLRAIWKERKLAPTKANLVRALRWVKRNTPEYISALSNCPEFNK
jgi:hypothetical protein